MAFLHRTYCVMVILATIILFLTPNAAAQNATGVLGDVVNAANVAGKNLYILPAYFFLSI
ncbi:unnamed protein product [Larinioides sclopetarius]|uniref:Uncharacterized protein n=1 Tax=Larinioides sclopetarius TaxID=280406 RepID=A0AAV2B9H3_9ARAC